MIGYSNHNFEEAHKIYQIHCHKEISNIDHVVNIQSASVKLLIYPQGRLDVATQSGQTYWRPRLASHLTETMNEINVVLLESQGVKMLSITYTDTWVWHSSI